MAKISEKKISDALYKKALGYEADEITEEYVIDEDGQCKLSKKKLTKKHISPDLTAVKMLIEKTNIEETSVIEGFTKEQLFEEKLKLIKLLEKKDN